MDVRKTRRLSLALAVAAVAAALALGPIVPQFNL